MANSQETKYPQNDNSAELVGSPLSPLRGWQLWLLRAAWAGITLLVLVLFVMGLPARLEQLNRILPQMPRMLLAQELGFGVPFEAYTIFSMDLLYALVWLAVGFIVFARKSKDLVGFLTSLLLITVGVGTSGILHALLDPFPALRLPILTIFFLGINLTLLVLYTLPDGRFTPRWTHWLALASLLWGMTWPFFPYWLTNLLGLSHPNQVLGLWAVIWLVWVVAAIGMLSYRYLYIFGPVERQQTRWVLLGVMAGVIGATLRYLPLVFVSAWQLQPGSIRLDDYWYVDYWLGLPLTSFLMALAPIALAFAVLRFRLWDLAPIVNQLIVYTMLTGALTVVYIAGIFLLQLLLARLKTPFDLRSPPLVVITTLLITFSVFPLRNRLQGVIDRRFYRAKLDLREKVALIGHMLRTTADLPELLTLLTTRLADELDIVAAAVYLVHSDQTLHLAKKVTSAPDAQLPDVLKEQLTRQLTAGKEISEPESDIFTLLIPLSMRQPGEVKMIGVLALGPWASVRGYSSQERRMLASLADQAGTAIFVAREIGEKQATEQRLAVYRRSPAGQAEVRAKHLLAQPQEAIAQMHRLAQQAGQDQTQAAILDNLAGVLSNLDRPELAGLAEGFNDLVRSQKNPRLLLVGLQTLTGQLARVSPQTQPFAAASRIIYELCVDALQVSSISRITHLQPRLKRADVGPIEFLGPLAQALAALVPTVEALTAYERVDTNADELAYLASGLERIGQVRQLARRELVGTDRLIVEQIVETWRTLMTGVIGELQTQAQIVCKLITQRSWQADEESAIELALSLRNQGRGAALDVAVNIDPGETYEVLSERVHLEQLTPGSEEIVLVCIRPHLAEAGMQLRVRFTIEYTDPRGPGQLEQFADLVSLLARPERFQVIPNPYVVGPPLPAGSPLFFGRQAFLASIEESMTAPQRNNLVLVGQRRMGKTSLLKQLTVRLADKYLIAFLDGQSLVADPGLSNFFLRLATEIAFAVEDAGFQIDLPTLADFVDSPSAAFEYRFLAQVHQIIDQRPLLILLDEFEELEMAVKSRHLDERIFNFLRHLVQHDQQVNIIFCGTHRLEALSADYWGVLFNISLQRHVGYLERSQAMRLIQEPVAQFGMRYDDLALDKLWRVTAGHPYFLQLLCHYLVDRHNTNQRSYITIADVNAVISDVVTNGQAHFIYLWAESSPAERQVLIAMSRLAPLTGPVTALQVSDYLSSQGVTLARQAINQALHQLVLRDILQVDEWELAAGERYRWQLGVLSLWVARNQPLSRLVDSGQVV